MSLNVQPVPADQPITPPDQDQKVITLPWRTWFQYVREVISALTASGTTTERPTTLLWIGRRFYDTSLNKPVYLSSVSGATRVWRDATGVIS